jgi:nitrite reductase/ring-hydroxylating ferredoxin subunit
MRSREVKMLVEVAKINELVPGGLKAYEVNGEEIVLCNYDEKIYAISRRCGHMNAPLDMGTLEGYILTCPMHCAQFDISTGEALSNPVPKDFGDELPPKNLMSYLQYIGGLMSKIKTCNIKTHAVKIEGNSIKVDIG